MSLRHETAAAWADDLSAQRSRGSADLEAYALQRHPAALEHMGEDGAGLACVARGQGQRHGGLWLHARRRSRADRSAHRPRRDRRRSARLPPHGCLDVGADRGRVLRDRSGRPGRGHRLGGSASPRATGHAAAARLRHGRPRGDHLVGDGHGVVAPGVRRRGDVARPRARRGCPRRACSAPLLALGRAPSGDAERDAAAAPRTTATPCARRSRASRTPSASRSARTAMPRSSCLAERGRLPRHIADRARQGELGTLHRLDQELQR